MERARDRRRAKAKRRDVLMKQASMERRIRIATETMLQHGPVKVLMRNCVPLDPPEIVEPELFVMIRRPNGQEIKFPISRK